MNIREVSQEILMSNESPAMEGMKITELIRRAKAGELDDNKN